LVYNPQTNLADYKFGLGWVKKIVKFGMGQKWTRPTKNPAHPD